MRNATTPFLSFVLWCSALVAQGEPAATVNLTGRVLDATGKPVVGAAVAFVPRESITTAQLLAAPPSTTDAEGRFTLRVAAAPEMDAIDWPSLQIAAKGHAAIAPSIQWKLQPPTPGAPTRPRADTDAGDFVLPVGARLFGRVRDTDGKGIVGASVTMRDVLDHSRSFSGASSGAHVRAVSNASGIFELPCALAHGVVLDFAAKDHQRDTLMGAAAGASLEVVLAKAGRVAGRVVDDKGALVAGAIVRATYERSGPTTRVRAAADGTFELPIEYAGRFRVSASRPRAATAIVGRRATPADAGESAVLDAPVATLEIVLGGAAASASAAPAEGSLRVQAVDAAGKPVVGIRATSVWQQFALQNESYLDYIVAHSLRGVAASEGNETTVKGPGDNDSRTGIVRVQAAGYAPGTERDVAWPDADKIAAAPPIVVKLVREATLAGTVVEESNGAPIAGAIVWATRKQDRSQGSWSAGNDTPEGSVTTGADGAFRIEQLGEGDWTVRWKHAERPAPLPLDLTLKSEEPRTGVELKLAAGARVAGRVTNLAIAPGSKVLLHPVAQPRFANMHYYSSGSSNQNLPKTPLASDGTFAFTGIALESFYLVVELPSPPRHGGPVYVPIEPFRVKVGGVQRDFDASTDVPGCIEGKLVFPKAVPEGAVLLVVADQVSENPDEQHYSSYNQWTGPRCFVQPDGSFVLPVSRGVHMLRVVDAASGLLLAKETERIVVGNNSKVVRTLSVPLAAVAVSIAGPEGVESMPWIDRLEVRHQPAKPEMGGMVFGVGNDEYDTGVGVPIALGTKSLRLFLPEGKVTLFVRSNASSLKPAKERGRQGPLVREEFDVGADEKTVREVKLVIGPAPEIEPKEAVEAKPKTDAVDPVGR